VILKVLTLGYILRQQILGAKMQYKFYDTRKTATKVDGYTICFCQKINVIPFRFSFIDRLSIIGMKIANIKLNG
jgi:hypothetical protein